MARKGTAQYKGAPRGGRPRRKKGEWVTEHNSRSNRDRTVVARPNRDFPAIGDVGSAAYRRLRRGK